MQTSSNFFNKSLINIEQQGEKTKKYDKYNQHHIVLDPLRCKDQLTPWTQINPRYNLNVQRLIKFKQKMNQQKRMEIVQEQVKQVKSEMISNLFNFYKNNKEKKRSTLNNAKRKAKNQAIQEEDDYDDNQWTLPSIKDRIMEQQLMSEQKLKNLQQKNKQKNKKKKGNYVQSISISEYLHKLKQKQKVIALSTIQKHNNQPNSMRTLDPTQQFTSNRYIRKSLKGIHDSLNFIKEPNKKQTMQRYGSVKNPQISQRKRNPTISALQSLQQSFQIYKRAAQKQLLQKDDDIKLGNKQKFSFLDKNLFKSNVPLSSLFFSTDLDSPKDHLHKFHQKSLSPRKYNTISFDKTSSHSTESNQVNSSLILPKVTKNLSYNK